MIHLIATIHVREGSVDEFAGLAEPCIEATRREEGCLHYDLHQSLTEPTKLVFVEKWADRDALNRHFREPHLIAFRDAGTPHIVERTIEIVTDGTVETL